MMRWIRHWLLPTRQNHYHPALIRPLGLFVIIGAIAFLPSLYNFTATRSMQVLGYATAISVSELNSLSNAERSKVGVAGLTLNSKLNTAAYNKANDMFAKNYWAHNAPDGTTPWSFMTAAGYSYAYAGENLAKNFSTSAGVVNGWMASPGHRANIVNAQFKDVGYAVVNGTLQGSQVTLVVAMYGAPYSAPAPKPAPKPAPAPAPTTTTKTSPAPTPAPTVTETPVKEAPKEDPEETQKDEEEAAPAITKEDSSNTPTPEAITTAPVAIPEPSAADVAGAMITAPVKAYTGLNWAQKTSLFLLSVLALLFVMKHTLIWRSRKKGYRHIWLRSHPLAQASFLGIMAIVTLLSGTGTIL